MPPAIKWLSSTKQWSGFGNETPSESYAVDLECCSDVAVAKQHMMVLATCLSTADVHSAVEA